MIGIGLNLQLDAGQGAGGFSPASLPGLLLWLKSTTGLYQDSGLTTPATADGDPVGGWKDLSGLAHHLLQSVSADRPTLKLAIQNGRPVVRFDGVADLLTAAFTLAQPAEIYFAANYRNPQAGGTGMTFFDGGTTNMMRLFQSNTNEVTMYAGQAGPVSPMTFGSWHAVRCLYDGSSSLLTIDNGSDVTGNPGASTPGGLTLGAQPTPASFMTVDFGEVFICNQAQSAANKAKAFAYLKAGWGTP